MAESQTRSGRPPDRGAFLIRSSLFVPAGDRRKVSKAAESEADQVVLDLEDSVLPARKEAARDAAAQILRELRFNGRVIVRINRVGSPWCHGDVCEIVRAGGQAGVALLVPGVRGAGEIHFFDRLLLGLESELELDEPIGLQILLESSAAFANLPVIAEASERVQVMAFGPGDLAAELGIAQTHIGVAPVGSTDGDRWQWAMSAIAINAAAIGARAIDGPYAMLNDRQGFEAAALRARALGFEGKLCIHPTQVPWANELFAPSDDEYQEAREVIEAYSLASREGRGVIVAGGAMVDEATRRLAERTVTRWEQLNAKRQAPTGGVEHAR